MARLPSLTGIITFYGVAAACIPLMVLGLFFLHIFSSNLEKEISQRNLVAARMAAREVHRLLHDCRIMTGYVFSRLMEKPDPPMGRPGAELEALLASQRLIKSLRLLGPDLTVKTLAPFSEDQVGMDLSGHLFIREAMKGGEGSWSGVYLSERTGLPTVSLAVGGSNWVLLADLDLSFLEEITQAMNTAAGDYAAMTDASGNVISHPQKAFVRERLNFSNLDVIRLGLEGREGTFRYEFLGEERIGSVAVVPRIGWLMVIVQPVKEAFSVIIYGRMVLIVVVASFGLTAFFLIWYLMRRATKPLAALSRATELITEGKYRLKGLDAGYREIDQILQGFKTMTAGLEKREREIKESEAKYRDLFENAVDIIYSLSPSGVIIDANDAFFRQGGYAREEVIGRPLGDFLVPEDRVLAGELHDEAVRGEAFSFEMRGKTKKGEIRWYSVISRPVLDEAGGLESIHCIARDITERRRAEEELKRSEKRYRDLFDSVSDLVYTQDVEGRFLSVNRALARISGYEPEEFVGKLPSDFMKPELRQLYADLYIKELKEKGFSRGTSVYMSKDGRKIYIEYVSNLVVPEQGTPYISGIARDVTDKVMAMRAIREREERISAILEATPVPTVVYDTEGKVQFMNSAFTEVFGWHAGELSGRMVPFVPEEEAEKTIKKIRELYREGKSSALETKRLTKDGRILDVIISAALIKGSSGRPRGMVVSLTDVTEQKRVEGVLQEAQKLEAIGVLAGGIAHDFNNLLMAIQGNVSLMLMDEASKTSSYQRLKDIEKYVEQGASLTRQLLGFARGGRYEVRALDLNEVIREHNRVFSRTRKDIVIEEEFEKGLWKVEADKGQMQQILMNLYVNAAQAMSEGIKGDLEPMKGGIIRVRTKNLYLAKEDASLRRMEPGRYVRISVQDTGKGMDRETLARIFEPFFTTKERGRGTGLGLASVYGIVKGHGGHVEAESEPGKGSEFRIFLPAAETEDKAGEAEPVAPDAPVRGSGTILLVDDEEMILEVGKAMLERLGYRVLTAGGGEKALGLFREKAREIDLVVLDMIMPGMSGEEVFEMLKAINPGVKVLVSSGYSVEGSARDLMASGCLGFIQKPFSLASLSTKVVEALT